MNMKGMDDQVIAKRAELGINLVQPHFCRFGCRNAMPTPSVFMLPAYDGSSCYQPISVLTLAVSKHILEGRLGSNIIWPLGTSRGREDPSRCLEDRSSGSRSQSSLQARPTRGPSTMFPSWAALTSTGQGSLDRRALHVCHVFMQVGLCVCG